MREIAELPSFSKPFRVERQLPSRYLGLQLPAKLADLPPRVRARVGRALDAGAIRYLRDDDGSMVVMWRRA